MLHFSIILIGILDIGMFLMTVCMHISRKTSIYLALYVAQSLLVASLFVVTALTYGGTYLYILALITVGAKAIMFPVLFSRFFRTLRGQVAAATYLNTPTTLVVLSGIAVLSFSALRASVPHTLFTTVIPVLEFAPLHLAGILSALFLAVNSKEAFSQIIALLVLENWVVFVATRAGFHQTLAIEVALTVEIVALIVIAITFMAMVFERFGTLDISNMTHLSEHNE